jgi:radical SAM/Cys-rich protein
MNSRDQIGLLDRVPHLPAFLEALKKTRLFPLRATGIEILQINTGRRCNLRCRHCHVEAGPDRTEMMNRETFAACLDVLRACEIPVIDVTGGEPELNPHLPWFVEEAARLGRRLLVRSNLVILLDERYSGLIDLYARAGVEIVTSLPDPSATRTDRQRKGGTFDKVMAVVERLNRLGYGREGSGLVLDVVQNPPGAYLPGPQGAVEERFRQVLKDRFGVLFNSLFTLTNCPIGRYLQFLVDSGNLDEYMSDLAYAFNPTAAAAVMCRTTLSVGYDGRLYDCDFNQALDLPVEVNGRNPVVDPGRISGPDRIDRFDHDALAGREIVIGNHCYACTAGAGSSCQGATAE